MTRRKTKKKYVMISSVADEYGIHPQTLRLYEREGLITPHRSDGNTRLYDDQALRRLEMILALTRDMGVNLAGVEVILRLREQMDAMKDELDRLRDAVDGVDQGATTIGVRRRHALVRVQKGSLQRVDDRSRS